MSSPCRRVINFNPDAPIECQKATPPTPAPPRGSAKVPVVHITDAVAAKSVPSKDFSHKPWKNIAITEYDDAEFEELQARMVFTWPPDLAAYRRAVEEESGSCEAAEYPDENTSPVAFHGASSIGSASTQDSPMILTPTQQDHYAQTACVPLTIPHKAFAKPEAGAFEKVVGLQRLRLKAPPPLSFNGKKKVKDVINEIGCTLLLGEGERTARDIWRNAQAAAQDESYVLFYTSAPHACIAVDKNGAPSKVFGGIGATSSGSLLSQAQASRPLHIELSLALPGIAQAESFSVSPMTLDDNVTVIIATFLIMVFTMAN
ncbi:hypothetical protein EDD22DRAFT_966472 [Suillus occidentalis]|nr:hypothetical protein EDD22DRAFT_966472 [Suillus occidentalis]